MKIDAVVARGLIEKKAREIAQGKAAPSGQTQDTLLIPQPQFQKQECRICWNLCSKIGGMAAIKFSTISPKQMSVKSNLLRDFPAMKA